MRISLLLPELATGGAERQFVQLANGLALRSHDVCLTTIHPGGELAGELEEGVLRRSLFDDKPARGVRLVRSLWIPHRIRAAVSEHGSEVAYSALYAMNALAHRALRGRVPLVWGLRGSRQALGLRRRIAFGYGRRHAQELDLAIFNSRAGEEFHTQSGFRFARKCVIPNGFDTDRFRNDAAEGAEFRRGLGLAPGEPVVGIVGRLTPVKDHELFLHAAAQAAATRPELRFLCVGDGAPRLRDRLEQAARSSGLGERLFFAGSTADMRAAYSALDVLALTSLGEGFPNVIGEAMACEVPVDTAGVGDAAYLVGECGTVVRSRRPADHARAWLELLASDSRRRVATAARRRIVSEFGLDACAGATEDALRSVLEHSRH